MANGLRFKGTISVLVDNSRLVARLCSLARVTWEYDEGALVRILADAGVVQGYDIEELISGNSDVPKN